jgi:hypothetical protein
MGNPIPAITEAVNENLGTWGCEGAIDFADLVASLPELFDALGSGLKKAIDSADPEEKLSGEVHYGLESLSRALDSVMEAAGDTSDTFERCYAFWLGRE